MAGCKGEGRGRGSMRRRRRRRQQNSWLLHKPFVFNPYIGMSDATTALELPSE